MKRCLTRILNHQTRQFSSLNNKKKSYLGYLFCIDAKNSSIDIKPGWTDSYTVGYDSNAASDAGKYLGLDVQESEEEDEMVTISSTSSNKLFLSTPQQVDLHVEAGAGGLCILGKVEGNCELSSKGQSSKGLESGEISIANTIRGETVNISAVERGGSVTIAKVIEATSMRISAHENVRALRLLGESISVTSGGSLRIGALYSSRSVLSALNRRESGNNDEKEIRLSVENMHGHAEVNGDGGSINISGVTGSVFVNHKGRGSVVLQMDSARGKSTVKSTDGPVTVQIARPISSMTLVLSSLTSIHIPEDNSDVSMTLLQRNVIDNKEFITVTLSSAARPTLNDRNEEQHHLNGGMSDQISGGSGKIRDGSPITGFYFSKDSSVTNDSRDKTALASATNDLPVIEVSTKGPIRVEFPSFIELVRSKTMSRTLV